MPNPSPRTRHLLKALAFSFVLFLIVIVTIANRGRGGRWWTFIHIIPYGDKLGHIGLMGTLSLLCNLAFIPRPVPFLPASITQASFLLFLLVSLEELSQAFLPTRSCDPLDWLADLTGLTLGQLAATYFSGRKP